MENEGTVLARFLPKIAPKPGDMIGHAFSINVSPLAGLSGNVCLTIKKNRAKTQFLHGIFTLH